jgi:hypothetical protein
MTHTIRIPSLFETHRENHPVRRSVANCGRVSVGEAKSRKRFLMQKIVSPARASHSLLGSERWSEYRRLLWLDAASCSNLYLPDSDRESSNRSEWEIRYRDSFFRWRWILMCGYLAPEVYPWCSQVDFIRSAESRAASDGQSRQECFPGCIPTSEGTIDFTVPRMPVSFQSMRDHSHSRIACGASHAFLSVYPAAMNSSTRLVNLSRSRSPTPGAPTGCSNSVFIHIRFHLNPLHPHHSAHSVHL